MLLTLARCCAGLRIPEARNVGSWPKERRFLSGQEPKAKSGEIRFKFQRQSLGWKPVSRTIKDAKGCSFPPNAFSQELFKAGPRSWCPEVRAKADSMNATGGCSHLPGNCVELRGSTCNSLAWHTCSSSSLFGVQVGSHILTLVRVRECH